MVKKKNKKKNRIIFVIIIAVVVGLFAYNQYKINRDNEAMLNRIDLSATTVVSTSAMADSLSSSGIVQSEEIKAIVAILNSEVLEVNVEIGDYVKEGDVLAVLDSTDIDKQVSLAKSSNSVTYQTGQLSYQQTLDQLKDVIDSGQTANDEIWENWTAAVAATDAAEAYYNALVEISVDFSDWDSNGRLPSDPVYAKIIALGLDEDITEEELQTEITTAKSSVSTAQSAADALGAQLATNNSIRFNAQDTYDQVTGVKPATSTEAKQILLQKQSLNNTGASLNNNLDLLKEQQAGAIIKATMDGTITSVGLTVGQIPTGIAFTIQNLDNLSITSGTKESDLADISEGMKVEISSNNIKDTVYDGTLDNIAPTGTISVTGDTTFTTKIMINNEDSKLKPGMNVKVKYILFEKENAIQVPYESIYTQNEIDYVLVMNKLDNGKYSLVPTAVTKGGVNDVNVEIMGVNIADRIVNYPENYLDNLDTEYELYEGMLDE